MCAGGDGFGYNTPPIGFQPQIFEGTETVAGDRVVVTGDVDTLGPPS